MNKINAAGSVTRPKPELTNLEIMQMFAGTKCVCGDDKLARRSFCSYDFYRLSLAQRKALYLQFGSGYEIGFLQALEALLERNRTTIEKIRMSIPGNPEGNKNNVA